MGRELFGAFLGAHCAAVSRLGLADVALLGLVEFVLLGLVPRGELVTLVLLAGR
jgi:hypothetical protein